MKKTFLPLAFLSMLFAISCKDGKRDIANVTPQLSGTYQTSPYITPGQLTMFTTGGKNTDQAFIKSCITRKLLTAAIYQIPDLVQPHDFINLSGQPKMAPDTLQLDFSNPQQLKLISRWETIIADRIADDPFFIFKRVDSTDFAAFPDFKPQYYIPVTPATCQLVSSGSNSYYCKWRYLYALGYENNQIYIPRTAMFLFTGKSNNISGGSGTSFRYKNDTAFKILGQVDTLIYQENRRFLNKL